jgi:o-succinylbenzoate synthase
MKLRSGRFVPVSLPLRAPLATAHGHLASRHGFVVCIEDDAGHAGWGECLPLEGFGLETRDTASAALRTGISALLEAAPEPLDAALDRVDAALPHAPATRAALDLALHDLFARRAGLRVADTLTKSARDRVGVATLLGGADSAALADGARAAETEGFRTLKLKLGARPWAQDAARVEAVRGAAPRARLRLDANGAWSEAEAQRALAALAALEPELVEQPLSGDAAAFARLRRASPVPIAADESIRDTASADVFLHADAIDAIMLKPAAVGGLRAAARIASRARERGVPIVVTSFLDSSLGIAGALELARALPDEDVDHGLTTDAWLQQDLAVLPPPHAGRRAPGPQPGLGIAPDPARLARASTGAGERITA